MPDSIILPIGYRSLLSPIETQKAIKLTKDLFEDLLADALSLTRVSAPMFVRPETGLNDDLSGSERAVSFDIPDAGFSVQIVHSLAKWKRYALRGQDFPVGRGIYTDMNAIRRDEKLDNLHSVYVDQWDWEKVISKEQRCVEFLKQTVRTIASALWQTEQTLTARFPALEPLLPREITFITSEELLQRYPNLPPRGREDMAAREFGIVFIMNIGGKLSNGEPHDLRAPDYDDWSLNGDILVWYPPLSRAVELSSMGIRVDEQSLTRQLELAGCTGRRELMFHRELLAGRLPLTIGGGIGQSRMCMVMLHKAHIGEVQASVWSERDQKRCAEGGILLL